MKPENLYHTGIIVDDLEAAKNWYARLGYRWTPTGAGEQVVQLADGERRVPMHVAYSLDTPRLELVQSVPGTIWTPTAAGVHHLGYWSDDVDADFALLVTEGAAFEAKSLGPNGAALWAYCRHPTHGRIELVGPQMRAVLEPMLAAAAV